MTDRTLLVVDGNSLAHRAWHAYASTGMRAADGTPTFAVYGFGALLAGICDKVRPAGVLVGFDDHTQSVRKATWPTYKATREKKDPDLYRQMDAIRALLEQLGVAVCVPAGLEADDVLGSAAAAAEAAGWRCVLATSDRDAFQLISERTTVLRLGSGLDAAVEYTPAVLQERYGITPAQYREYAALRGDTSDNLPGVAGVGEKTAARLLAAAGTIAGILADPAGVAGAVGRGGARAVQLVAGGQETVTRNLAVMAIRRDLDVDLAAATLRRAPHEIAAAVTAAGFPGLAGRLAVALAGPGSSVDDAPLPEPPAEETGWDDEPWDDSYPDEAPAAAPPAPDEPGTAAARPDGWTLELF